MSHAVSWENQPALKPEIREYALGDEAEAHEVPEETNDDKTAADHIVRFSDILRFRVCFGQRGDEEQVQHQTAQQHEPVPVMNIKIVRSLHKIQ